MLKIRLTRMGAKKNPFYRVVVIDAKEAVNGTPVATVGWYDPAKADAPVKLNEEENSCLARQRRTAYRYGSFSLEEERYSCKVRRSKEIREDRCERIGGKHHQGSRKGSRCRFRDRGA